MIAKMFNKNPKSSIILGFLFLFVILVISPSIIDFFDNSNIPNNNGTTPNNNGTIPVNNTANKNPILRVNGTNIVDINNSVVILNGILVTHPDRHTKINSTDTTENISETFFTSKDVKMLKDIGVNMIDIHGMRLWELIRTFKVVQEDFFINYVDQWVNWCTENKLYVNINIVGFANANIDDGNNYVMPRWMYTSYGPPKTDEEQSQIIHDFWDIEVKSMDDEREYFYKIWRYISERYKDNPYVMYSLVNEPIHHTYKQADSDRLEKLGLGYSKIITNTIDEIRSTGSEQLIFVDKPYLVDINGNSTWSHYIVPINRTGIVWEAHVYISNNRSVEGWLTKVEEFKEIFINQFGKPLFIGEWHINPIWYRYNITDWKGDTLKQKLFLEESGLSGTFHSYGKLFGYSNWYYSRFNYSLSQDEVNYIIDILYNKNVN